jgi:hypothetical protein
MSFLRLASVGALVVGGCMGLEDDLEYGEVEQQLGCPSWICGENSPHIVANYPFHELPEKFNMETAEGYTITGVKKGGVWYPRLDIDRAKIFLKDSVGNILLAGPGLVGVEIRVQHTDGAGTKTFFALKIMSVGSTPFYADNNGVAANPLHETYIVHKSPVIGGPGGPPTNEWRNLCSNPTQDRTETLNMPGDHMVFFEGDRIDKVTKRYVGIDDTWFNLGCAGHTLAKMALSGHTESGKHAGYITTVSERQTLMKMFVADYCGLGVPFTVSGQALQWMDRKGWMKYSSPWWMLGHEGRWGPNGITCMDQPRVDANGTPASFAEFGNSVLDEMGAICGAAAMPPPCAGSVLFLDGHHLNSANP